ncbi:MAG: RsmB/NOP family class I SAM-dependent RNA methyltransferase [Parvularcula sp.]
MRLSGRIAAAIDVLSAFEARRVPLKIVLADWARGARYAGSGDRAFISGLCLDVLRHKSSLSALDGGDRVSVARCLTENWGLAIDDVRDAYAEMPHGPGALEPHEQELIEKPLPVRGPIGANVPEFCWSMLERVSEDPVAEGLASCVRAPFDLRINSLKSDTQRVVKALAPYEPSSSNYVKSGVRIKSASADRKSPQLTVTPAYNKGWVEVQDEGSQIAALAAGDVRGKQVLDFCAGGGGKTLALAALMDNSGQIHAYDNDAKRLAPIFERLARAGIRNAQIISPAESPERLEALRGRMNVVFVDAPCSGSGTWRRRPDSKWRLTPEQLETRMAEQDAVLEAAEDFVAPGGALVYVTCSIFAEENEDRAASFLQNHPDFEIEDPIAPMVASGGLMDEAAEELKRLVSPSGTLRLSPLTTGTDGFGITRLRRTK